MSMFRAVTVMAAAAAVLAGGSGASAAAAPALELKPCTLPDGGGEARCGTFRVPEDRSRPGGRILPLKVVVIPAKSKTPLEPVFLLSGGPGQAATDAAPYIARSWEPREHDVVLMDLRGTGEGSKLDCLPPSDEDLQAFLEPPFSDRARYHACRIALAAHADLTKYVTPIAMQDLDELRQALGYDQIDLEGGSYGTRAGLAYMHAYGRHVHAAAMSGLAPFANRNPLYHAPAAQRAFDRIVAECEAEAACKAAYPHLHQDLAEIIGRLKQTPVHVQVKHPKTGAPAQVTVTDGVFADAVRVMMYSAEGGRRLPLLLQQARAGDFSAFAQAALNNGYGLAHALAEGLLLAVTCSEDVARITPEDVKRVSAGTFLGDRRVKAQMAACADWPRARMPSGYYDDFQLDVPALLVSGDLDPVTPPQWGEAYRRYLPNSLQVVDPGAHVAGGPCLDGLVEQLFRTGTVKGLDGSCVRSEPLPPFALK
jgi:pimeloyl-ACP methyl ester carboxylesterase